MEDGRIVVTFKSEVDKEKLKQDIEEVQRLIAGAGIQAHVAMDYVNDKDTERESKDTEKSAKSAKEALKDYLKDDENKLKLVSAGVKQAEKAISSSITKGFGIVKDIYGRMKAASPLLQTIESLFNLAMTLFFMPLGNKLAEVLIPATLELLDNVVELWDSFEGKTLGEMLGIAINQGVKLFGEYFNNIGGLLKEQGGYAAKIGELLEAVGNFIEGPGITALTLILSATTFILSHLKEFIALWITIKVAEMAINALGFLGQMGANVGPAAIATAVLLTAGAGFGSYGVMTGLGMAEGGYVPAKAGGSLKVLGEGGKGEYVIPEDKLGSYGGSVTYNIYGYTDSELKSIIKDTVNEQVSQSRIRGSF